MSDIANVPAAVPTGDLTAKYLIQTADATLPNAQVMGALATGIVANANGTGVQSIVALSGLTLSAGVLGNDLLVPTAGSKTIVGGSASGNNGALSSNPSQNGQFQFGTMTTPGFFQDTTTALGTDFWCLRSGKDGGGVRQVLTLANRGNTIGDDVSLGFEPKANTSATGGTSQSLARIDGILSSPNNTDLRFYVNLTGASSEVFRLDGFFSVARFMRGFRIQRASKTGTYAAGDGDTMILADATSGAFDVTLPSAVSRSGQIYGVKRVNSGANAVTIKSASGTLDRVAAATGVALTAQDMVRWYISDGTNWFTIMGYL